MECICRDLVRHIRFQQERYSPGYYPFNVMTRTPEWSGDVSDLPTTP